jgi:hypothetical protein
MMKVAILIAFISLSYLAIFEAKKLIITSNDYQSEIQEMNEDKKIVLTLLVNQLPILNQVTNMRQEARMVMSREQRLVKHKRQA